MPKPFPREALRIGCELIGEKLASLSDMLNLPEIQAQLAGNQEQRLSMEAPLPTATKPSQSAHLRPPKIVTTR